ncbi:Protein ABC1, mitochondrial [Sphaceloma murrayae]|uniref:Protein ABC1, mitochondrial n=1 Tax=Sphaceloma murrayae TaxID=2082308 RepID=A0A2K1QJY3_9PEZI|nr:Protein ABC1, mitochondrial [Sphaceloma murrayae]
MSGKRLLDAARFYGALRSVVKTHFTIRSQQLDSFSKTSSLAKAVKNQTDRVTVTAGAAYALARRFAETDTQRATPSGREAYSTTSAIPRKDAGQSEGTPVHDQVAGLKQDHHYERSEGNAVQEPAPQGSIDVTQEKARRHALPDGTIPPEGSALGQGGLLGKDTTSRRGTEPRQDPMTSDSKQSDLSVSQAEPQRDALTDGSVPPAGAPIGKGPEIGGEDTYSDRPDPEPSKQPLEQQHRSGEELRPKDSTRSTIPDPSFAARKAQQLSEMQIPSQSASEVPESSSPDTFSSRPRTTSTTLSSLPRTKIPKNAETSEGAGSLQGQRINQDVYYDASPETKRDSVTDEAVPEGIDLNIFHSPQVASLINSGGRDDRRKAYEKALKEAREKRASEGSQKTTASNAGPLWGEGDVVRDESDRVLNPEKPDVAETKDTKDLAASLAAEAKQQETEGALASGPSTPKSGLHESSVPSSRLGRIWQFSGLATSMAFGAVSESFRRATGSGTDGSIMLSEANMNRLVSKLSRMRGAALKLGQMMSFQDSKLLPPAINAVLARVQDSADYMPPYQRDQVLARNLGADWKDLFSSFEDVPIAAASIGQVHKAVLAANNQTVAVKVQYPGVRDSITSDLNNISLLLTASRLLPKGLYLDKTIANAKTELAWECDYVREAECGRRFHSLLQNEADVFTVPKVYTEASGPEVLTAEFMGGKAVTKIPDLTQQERDWIGTQILRLCLRELMEWRFMQTDPNWTNFLYNRQTGKLELLDFGASREYPAEFVTPYVQLLIAASKNDRATVRERSIELGYLTGQESKAMLEAHVDSILTLAEPFLEGADLEDGVYDFRDQTITDRVRSKIGLMVRERLAPPPEETYSLHRKLSGAFLLCARLGSRVGTRGMFEEAVENWRDVGNHV